MPDRFVNGDPTNDNTNKTSYEHDPNSNQMRHGGDIQGIVDTLDYLQGMQVKGLYIAGSPFKNQPWGYDQYSPLDLSVLDDHFGTIQQWRSAIDAIHARGMYVVLDNTFATLGDLIGFDGYLNTTTPFTMAEHKVQYKTDLQYYDFEIGNNYNKTCDYPRFWNETGYPVEQYVIAQQNGCYDSEFDQYGDTEAFGVFPDWRRELSKFASVQDRLREWHAPTRAKLENFYCMLIAQLDVDGFRYDKATQSTVDAMGSMNEAMRRCAKRFGKDNFFLPGEITGGNDFGAIFIGRGRQPDQLPETLTDAVQLTNTSDDKYFIRDPEYGALDAAAFHYTVYRTLTRFLGMDGNLEAGYDAPQNWIDMWNTFLLTNDFVNPSTGVFDPRHMYGVTNQDVFRWGAITDGIQRQLLGHFITYIHLPGVPLLLWGEEQSFHVLDNTASNYIFGRQAMSSATAWQTHGCYHLDSTQYFKMPLDAARRGCEDNTNSYDHRDPSAPVRNILKRMTHLRDLYPVLLDGYFLQQLSNQTVEIVYPGSSGVQTETGMWSVMRSEFAGIQELPSSTPVWLLYSNKNESMTYEFDCSNNDTNLNITALIAPYDSGTTVKNLFYPYDEQTLEDSPRSLGINGSTSPNGCLSQLDMAAYDYRAYVPKADWVGPTPMITKFSPGHDARLLSNVTVGGTQSVDVEIQFSTEMDCDSVTNSITFNSTTEGSTKPTIGNVNCNSVTNTQNSSLVGAIYSAWSWSATLQGVENGVHALTVRNASSSDGAQTNANDRFLFRLGQANNPIVFPRSANYSSTLLVKADNGSLMLNHSAAGADMFRYSTNFASSFSNWLPYEGGSHEITKQDWSGTSLQKWHGDHVRVDYFTRLGGSSDNIQESDVGTKHARRFPHMFLNGPYNEYGYDAGLPNKMKLSHDYTWTHNWMVEWNNDTGSVCQLNVWGINPDGKPDATTVMGDADGDSILDRLPPSSLSSVVLNVTEPPPRPYLAWRFVVNDGDLRFTITPVGSMWATLALFTLLWIVPVLTAAFSCWLYAKSFYGVKFNEIGLSEAKGFMMLFKRQFKKVATDEPRSEKPRMLARLSRHPKAQFVQPHDAVLVNAQAKRRTVLIATMEYDIEDWAIKIKIGGLGVMAQLMGKNLGHQDLIWVVPCVGGVDYPVDREAEPMTVTILGVDYEIGIQYHTLRNITYVLLDAPVFRQQTKSEPYPARMDDMTSAIYYSAWNQCIAQAITRFPIDLYHINDYHGTIAPLYLLPRSIPAALSLHNAEFQGLWPMRNKQEREEVCAVFNLSPSVVSQYVQFGEVFNLLHAGASILRVHQQGFGAVGVSKKYGKRSYARYPIFWGLKKVQALPNPDPSDTGEWDKQLPKESDIVVDPNFEKTRLDQRIEAQKWAGLEENPNAELFVFVGRWSMQKGIDLIADVFPALLESKPNVQLITVGPVIDLYGKFAALKFEKLMKMYPTRVCSKPVFTALPPFIFTGAEFALIPSRDEPFGLVAVEFGRKGALGVGARVGGLGQMPGWWYTVESTTTAHLLTQFKMAIQEAMDSKLEVRAMMRARSAKQRFPVAQWVEDLEILQSTSIRIHDKVEAERRHVATGALINSGRSMFGDRSGRATPGRQTPGRETPYSHGGISGAMTPIGGQSRNSSYGGLQSLGVRLRHLANRDSSYRDSFRDSGSNTPKGNMGGLKRQASLGSHRGPGHVQPVDVNDGVVQHDHLAPIIDVDDTGPGLGRMIAHGPGAADFSDSSEEEDDEPMAMPARSRPRMLNRDSSTLGDLDLTRPGPRPLTQIDSPPFSPDPTAGLLPPPQIHGDNRLSATPSMLSINEVVGEKKDFKLQQVDPFFTDTTGEFYDAFSKKLETLDAKNSESTNCIEDFLIKSEKHWFDDYRNAKLGRLHKETHSNRPSMMLESRPVSVAAFSTAGSEFPTEYATDSDAGSLKDEFLLGADYKPPTGIAKWMQIKIGDWPAYTFLMAFGQIIAANSYQITLLTGEVGQTAAKLYVIASIYLVTSVCWWILYRRFPSVFSLSLPFFFYGVAFVLIGTAHFGSSSGQTGWIQNAGTGFYAVASSSGSIFFALNFGDEGGAQVKAWVFRACVIQGTQQIYVVALWYWGSILSRQERDGILPTTHPFSDTWKITAITLPIAVAMWTIGIVMYLGLPKYYRQAPGGMPSFYKSLARRKIVLWFFVTVIIQNFFLSAPYGRNWTFLFSSVHAKTWQVIILVAVFFIGVWALFLWIFGILSKEHSWILPLFAIGLGAPRWAQIWWGTSGVGLWLPFMGGPTAGALASRSLWLWLGTLDAIQGVGLGMILLGTLTRVHVLATLIAAQVLGSVATMVARAVAPNKIGPGPISPNIGTGVSNIWQVWFWLGLGFNLVIVAGFYKFYRKEQLQKP